MTATTPKTIFVELVTSALVILFIYTGTTKLLYHDNFVFELGRSPYLQSIKKLVAVVVPVAELVIALLLVIRRSRLWGLYAAFALMAFFTGYVWIMLKVSYDLPCSCGGILEALSWDDHLLLNAAITGLTLAAIFFHYTSDIAASKKIIVAGAAILIVAATLTTLIYWADAPNTTKNGFIVKLLPKVLSPINILRYKEPNKQFCGATASRLYFMGKTPRELIITDYALQIQDTITLNFPLNERILSAYTPFVDSPNIFLLVNNSAALLTASMATPGLPARNTSLQTGIFTSATRINNSTLVVRALDSLLPTQVFMKVNALSGLIQHKAALLENKNDMGFSQDGLLQYDNFTNRVIYLQYYTNQWLCLDSNLAILYRANTIDTFTSPNIPVKQFSTQKGSISQLPAAPVKPVNRYAATCKGRLFVLSNLKADNETDSQFSNNSRIDVYDMATGKYSHSFYIPPVKGEKLLGFYCVNDIIVAVYDTYVSTYAPIP